MIYSYRHLKDSTTHNFDVCVIGSGAGGAAAFSRLTEKSSKKVLLLEGGSFLLPKDFSQKEEDMFPKLFFDAGGRRTNDKAIRILHGHGLGGSTVHNINLCKRIPEEVLDSWNIPLSHMKFSPYLDQVEKDLMVQKIAPNQINKNNELFRNGVVHLGYKGGLLQHNRNGCMESGFCELGCSFNAKMNAMRVYVPRGVKKGGTVFVNTKALRFVFKGKKIDHLVAEVIHPETREVLSTQKIFAQKFVLSGGAIESPLLLQRSDVKDPFVQVGKHLRLHPGAAVSGEFSKVVNSWEGIPQSYESTEFLSFDPKEHNKRIWLIAGSAHPIGAASVLPGFGKEHEDLIKRFPYFATVTPMLHDYSEGKVELGHLGSPSIEYELNEEDKKQMEMGIFQATKILLAAGAKRVLIPGRRLRQVTTIVQLEQNPFKLAPFSPDLVAVHPMGTLRMGTEKNKSCTDHTGKYHHLDNLYIADTSLYTTSLGVPPQITTYAFGLYVADQLMTEKES